MAFWVFKVSNQKLYADVEGVRYEYDNRHSVHVRPRDRFVYLDKRDRGYQFTGTGTVSDVQERRATETERRRGKTVRTVYTALLTAVTWFEPPVDISRSSTGLRNREALGIPTNVNMKGWGWSISMPSISAQQFERIVTDGLQATTG